MVNYQAIKAFGAPGGDVEQERPDQVAVAYDDLVTRAHAGPEEAGDDALELVPPPLLLRARDDDARDLRGQHFAQHGVTRDVAAAERARDDRRGFHGARHAARAQRGRADPFEVSSHTCRLAAAERRQLPHVGPLIDVLAVADEMEDSLGRAFAHRV